MILGASYSQLPLYEAAKRLGVFTVAASTPGDWPGFDIADESSYTDISDCEAVLEAVANLGLAQGDESPAAGQTIDIHGVFVCIFASLDLCADIGALPFKPVGDVGELGFAF